MASYTAKIAAHETLVANVVDVVTLQTTCGSVTVSNRTGTGEIYVVVGGGSPPTVGGDPALVLPASICSRVIPVPLGAGDGVEVQLISSVAQSYSVEANPF